MHATEFLRILLSNLLAMYVVTKVLYRRKGQLRSAKLESVEAA